MVARVRTFVIDAYGCHWFDCAAADKACGWTKHKSSREAALEFATEKGRESVINIACEWDEKSRRVMQVFYWAER